MLHDRPIFQDSRRQARAFHNVVPAICREDHSRAEVSLLWVEFRRRFGSLPRVGYKDAAGLLAHLENVADLLRELFKIDDITRLEVHGPAQEIEQLRKPLADLSPQFFTLEYGFRR
jgi:hypothetical protein